MTARRVLRWTHRWLGLVSAVFVLLVAGSGGLLAFMPQLFMAQYGDVVRADAPRPGAGYVDADALLAAATSGYGKPIEVAGLLMPDTRIQGLETALIYGMPVGGDEHDTVMLSVDPYTAAFKGVFRLDDALGHQLTHFHYDLFIGPPGQLLVAVLGVLLIVFALTGLWLWWPRRGSVWRKAKQHGLRSGPKRMWLALHNWTGVWSSLLIIMFATTGVAASKPEWLGPLVEATPYAPPPSMTTRTCAGPVTPGQAASDAAMRFPRHALTGLSPAEDGGPIRLTLRAPGDHDRMYGDLIVFASSTCRGQLQALDLRQGTLAQQAGQIAMSLHGGYTFGPVLGRVLVLATAIMLLMLTTSGLLSWLRRTWAKRALSHPALKRAL